MPNGNNSEQPPNAKRQRLSDDANNDGNNLNEILSATDSNGESSDCGDSGLSARLQNLLECIVCRDVPHPEKGYQCSRGHILCEDCKNHILAVANINDMAARCPNCRVPVNCFELKQNLVVRQTLWELPSSCPCCNAQISGLKNLSKHLMLLCEERTVRCKYHYLGCGWMGSHKDSVFSHGPHCEFPQKKGKEILEILRRADAKMTEAQIPMLQLHRKLSASRIFFSTLKMIWIPTMGAESSEDICARTLESETIAAFEENWVLRLHLTKAGVTYIVSCQLLLTSNPREDLMVDHFIQTPQSICGAKQQQDICMKHYRQLFDSTNIGAPCQELRFAGPQAMYTLFAMTPIRLRLWMFLHS